MSITNAMTVDVEDYFHVTAFAKTLSRSEWSILEYRAEQNTEKVLNVFAEHGVSATFFVLGWVAKRSPGLIKKIMACGHEVACHGMTHQLIYNQTPEDFLSETRDAKMLLEDLISVKVRGYRAASYSITNKSMWAMNILADLGFDYDSSIFPVRHDIYGVRDAPRGCYSTGVGALLEMPLTTVELMGQRLPCSGGGYFRILPYAFTKWAFTRVNTVDRMPGIFYFHPWEIDPNQPVVKQAPLKSRFRHYTNLSKTETRLKQLLIDFQWGRMDQVFGLP